MKTSRLVQAGVVTLALVLAALGGVWIVGSGPRGASADQQSAEHKYTEETKNHERLMECYEVALRMDQQRTQALSQLDPNTNPAAKNPAEDTKVETQPQAPPLTIDSVGMSDDGFYALVNGALVHEGDMVDGYTVRRIHPNRVEFEKEGQVVVLFMN
jgi:hypothetical protein